MVGFVVPSKDLRVLVESDFVWICFFSHSRCKEMSVASRP